MQHCFLEGTTGPFMFHKADEIDVDLAASVFAFV